MKNRRQHVLLQFLHLVDKLVKIAFEQYTISKLFNIHLAMMIIITLQLSGESVPVIEQINSRDRASLTPIIDNQPPTTAAPNNNNANQVR